MKQKIFFVVCFLTLFCLMYGSVFAEPVKITDILDREVTVDVPPTLAVITGKKTSTITEVPFMFEYGKGHVAVPSGGQDGGKFISLLENPLPELKDATVESVAAMKPDVIFLKSYTREDAGIAYEETGIPVIYLSLESIDDYHTDVMNVGKIFGEEKRAEEILAYYDDIVKRVTEKASAIKEKKNVLLLQYSESNGAYSLKVAPAGWLQTTMVEMAGGEPVWKEIGLNANSWTDVSFEQIAAWDPDVILVVNYFSDPKVSVEQLKNSTGWDQIRAVKENQIFPFAKDTFSWDSSSPRWGLGLLWTFKTLYPESAQDIDIDAEMLKFYKWFGLSDESIQANLIDLFHAEPQLTK